MPECEDCEEEFETKSGLSTHRTHKHDDSSVVELECKECGETFEEYESQLENEHRNSERNFCSRDCYTKWQKHARRLDPEDGKKNQYTCMQCGEEYWAWPSQKEGHPGNTGDRNYCSWDCLQEWREENTEGNVYYGPNWEETVEEIHERDEVCQVCGEDGSDAILDVHHIVPIREFESYEEANDDENLVLLCREHHKQIELGQMACPDPTVEQMAVNSAAISKW